MNKPWDTLFHLSSFMKYLLLEVLPDEKSDCPQYILDSLFELHRSTLKCIKIIQGKNVIDPVRDSHDISKKLTFDLEPNSATSRHSEENNEITRESPQKRKHLNDTTKNEAIPTSVEVQNEGQRTVEHALLRTKTNANRKTSCDNVGTTSVKKNDKLLNNELVDGQLTSQEVHYPTDPDRKNENSGKSLKNNSKKNKKKLITDNNSNENINIPSSVEKSQIDFEESNVLCKSLLNENLSGGSGLVRHQNLIISKNFLFLNELVVNKDESFGFFCLSCDKCFFSESDWISHSTDDWLHLDKVEKTNNTLTQISCETCQFFVFGNFALIEVYIDFHVKSHSSMKSSSKSKQIYEKENKSCEHDDDSATRSSIAENIETSKLISPVFAEINREFVSENLKEGYYCGICDEKFYAHESWLKHFQEFHNKINKNENFYTCEICHFIFFNLKKSIPLLVMNHNENHGIRSSKKAKKNKNNITQPPSVSTVNQGDESLVSFSRSSRTQCSQQSPIPYLEKDNSLTSENGSKKIAINESELKKDKTERQGYKIVPTFLELDEMIHKEKIIEAYYCRPCDEYCLSQIHWTDHSKNKRHVFYMSDSKFKNSEAICDYCNLLFFGTESSIVNYFKFHAAGHGKAPSYHFTQDEKMKNKYKLNKIEVNENCNVLGKRDDSNLKTFSDSNVPDKITPLTKKNQSASKLSGKEEENIVSNLKKLYLIRKKEKLAGKVIPFGGYCLLCDAIIEDGFDWLDHVELSEHLSRVRQNDEEVNFAEFNLRVFGNKPFIKSILF